MKTTGIVRRIDDLGRGIIPSVVRNGLGFKEGEPLEIFIDEEDRSVTFRHYLTPFDRAQRLAEEHGKPCYELLGCKLSIPGYHRMSCDGCCDTALERYSRQHPVDQE